MLCPKDMVQMHQYSDVGGGRSEDEHYETWEIKECPACGRRYKEFYSATLIYKPEKRKKL